MRGRWRSACPFLPLLPVQPLYKVRRNRTRDHQGMSTLCTTSSRERYSGRTMYTIRQAAARTGVPVSLLRAWERRYAIGRPTRTPAGYRLYDDEAIERLRTMRRLV